MYYSEEDILRAEHGTLCEILYDADHYEFVVGMVAGIARYAENLLNPQKKEGAGLKKEGDG